MGESPFSCVGIFHSLVINTFCLLIIVTGMNYYLSIIPFLGAVEAGLFGQLPYEIEILPPEDRKDNFCYSVKDCWSRMPKLMDDWKAFFEVNKVFKIFLEIISKCWL